MSPVLGIGLLLCGLFACVPLFLRYPAEFGFCGLCAATILDCLHVWDAGISLGVSIYSDDIACAAIICSAIIVAIRSRGISRNLCWPATILLGMAALNFLRGIILYGLKPAGNGARDLCFLVIPVVAFSSMRLKIGVSPSRITIWLGVASAMFAAIAVFRWIGVLPIPEGLAGDSFRDLDRVLSANEAIAISQGLIAIMAIQIIRGVRVAGILAAAAFGAILLALQHRSVWVATAAGGAWLVLRFQAHAGRELARITVVCLGGTLLGVLLLVASGKSGTLLSLIGTNVAETQQSDSTWAWRVSGFSEATERTLTNGIIEAAIGPASGRDLSNTASFASAHIHDRYIDVLAYYGVFGLAVFMWWLWAQGTSLRSIFVMAEKRREMMLEVVLLESLLISEMVYFVPYFGGLRDGMLLGLLWVAAAQEHGPLNHDLSSLKWQPKSAELSRVLYR
jgi:hypothetical protein